MKIEARYDFWEEYIPPRCRKPKSRKVEKIMNVNIKEISGEIAPIAIITTTYEHRNDVFGLTDTVYRWFNKQLFTPCISKSGNDTGKQYTVADVMYRINETGYPANATEQDRIKQIRKNAKHYLIIDGVLYERSGEPRYNITTFGLGHNHGGTGFFIDTHYNSNLSKDSYFNALERDKAIAYFNRVALGRGDTDSVDENPSKNIKVLIPEAVKCNPQKEHGDGDPFLNSLYAMTQNSSSVMESGLCVMAMGLAEINKEEN